MEQELVWVLAKAVDAEAAAIQTDYKLGIFSKEGSEARLWELLGKIEVTPPTLDPKDQSAVDAESQLFSILGHLQHMVTISYFWDKDTRCDMEYDPPMCQECDHTHFCNHDAQVSKLLTILES